MHSECATLKDIPWKFCVEHTSDVRHKCGLLRIITHCDSCIALGSDVIVVNNKIETMSHVDVRAVVLKSLPMTVSQSLHI